LQGLIYISIGRRCWCGRRASWADHYVWHMRGGGRVVCVAS
jgi:hypothetical protein